MSAALVLALSVLAGAPSPQPSPPLRGGEGAEKAASSSTSQAGARPPLPSGERGTASPSASGPRVQPPLPSGERAGERVEAKAPEQASPKEVRSRLGKAQPKLGEPFDWEVEVRHPRGESYALPDAYAAPPFQVALQGCRREAAGDETLTTCAVRLTLFELGAHDLPTLRLEAATPGGPRVLDVPGPRVEAAGVIDPAAPPDALQLRPPAPAVPLLLPTWRPVWAALALLGLAALAFAAWRWWRRRARRAEEPPPPIPPAERFARRLDALAADRLAEQGRVREHFFRLSEAVREYVGAISGLNALDLTTAELVDALRAQGETRLDVEALRGFSEDADLIKFARFPAGGYECEAGLRYARDLLERTRAHATATSTSTSTSTKDAAGGPP